MERFKKTFRLQADSVEGIAAEFAEAAELVGRKVRFGRRKVKPGPLLNAIALHFVRMDALEREAFAIRAITEMEAFLEAEAQAKRNAESATVTETTERRHPDDVSPSKPNRTPKKRRLG